MMPIYLVALFVAVLAGGKAEAQTIPATADAAAITQAFLRSQALKQGDMESLKRAEAEFTPEGLSEFIKKMDGFFDEKGAPTFTQEFVPSVDAIIASQRNDVVTIHISGQLKQTHNNSTTTYPGTFEVDATGNLPKIAHFSLLIIFPK